MKKKKRKKKNLLLSFSKLSKLELKKKRAKHHPWRIPILCLKKIKGDGDRRQRKKGRRKGGEDSAEVSLFLFSRLNLLSFLFFFLARNNTFASASSLPSFFFSAFPYTLSTPPPHPLRLTSAPTTSRQGESLALIWDWINARRALVERERERERGGERASERVEKNPIEASATAWRIEKKRKKTKNFHQKALERFRTPRRRFPCNFLVSCFFDDDLTRPIALDWLIWGEVSGKSTFRRRGSFSFFFHRFLRYDFDRSRNKRKETKKQGENVLSSSALAFHGLVAPPA